MSDGTYAHIGDLQKTLEEQAVGYDELAVDLAKETKNPKIESLIHEAKIHAKHIRELKEQLNQLKS